MTECNPVGFEFQGLGQREIRASFHAPAISSHAGGLLLRELARVDSTPQIIASPSFANSLPGARQSVSIWSEYRFVSQVAKPKIVICHPF